MAQKLLFLIVGVAVGVVGGWYLAKLRTAEAPPEKDFVRLEETITALRGQGEAQRQKIAQLEEELAAARPQTAAAPAPEQPAQPAETVEPPPEAPSKVPTYAEVKAAISKFEAHFRDHILGNAGEAEKELTTLLGRAGAETIRKLMDEFDEAGDIGQKTFLAHVLGLSHRPEAVKHLEEVVADAEKPMMDRRMAVHGLAFSGAEGLDPVLRKFAEEDPDRGVRANAAFGLYRRGNDAGVSLYFKAADEAFAEKDPLAAQYLTGVMLMDKRALPAARERLRKYEDWQARVVLIEYLKGQKDRDSLPVLQDLANDESENSSVRKAATTAIKVIEAE